MITPSNYQKRSSSPQIENKIRSKTLQNEKYEELSRDQILSKSIKILQKPLSLRTATEKLYIHQLLSYVNYFQSLLQSKQQLVYEIAEALQYSNCQQNDIIFKQGENGDKFYIILQGVVSVRINVPIQDEFVIKEVTTIKEGGSFGELALQSSQPRTATVVAVTNCHFATMDKITYRQLVGDFNKVQLDQKIQFLSKYPWFQQWSLRELKLVAYEIYEKQYDYGDRININNYIGMIVTGQIELKRFVEKKAFQDHPLKLSKTVKQSLQIEILDENKIIGELNFLDKEGNLKFMINKFNKPYVKSAADPQIKDFIVSNQSLKGIYEPVCHSNHVTLYLLKISTLEDRFYDQFTRQLFQSELKKLLNCRIKKAFNIQIEYDKQYNEILEEQQISITLSKQLTRKSTPIRQGTAVRSKNDEDFLKNYGFIKKIQNKLPNGILYKYQRMFELEEKSKYVQQMEKNYDKLKSEENEAQENLKSTSFSMNCSYYRIKSHFNKRKFNKLFFQAYMKNPSVDYP